MKNFTKKDIEDLQAYVIERQALDDFRESVRLSSDQWVYIMDTWTNDHIIPPEYADRIGQREILAYSPMVKREEPTRVFYDKFEEEEVLKYIAEHGDPEDKYKEAVNKLIISYGSEADSNGFLPPLDDLLARLLEEPQIKMLLERRKTPFIVTIPNGEPLQLIYRVISSKSGRLPSSSKKNRHEKITTEQSKKGNLIKITRTNEQKESSIAITFSQAETFLTKQSKTFAKVMTFVLEKMTAQNFQNQVTLSLQEMVDRGMYSTKNNALKGAKSFFEQQKEMTLSGTVKAGRRTIAEEGGILFYHYSLKNGYLTFDANPKFNFNFIASYFTQLPSFAYSLNNNAFLMVRYIFSIARQNTKSIKEKGSFTISLDSVRENIGLPSIDEVKNRKYKQFIIDPIEDAIEEIEKALQNLEEAKDCAFTITPYGTDTSNIMEWLQGYLEIGLKGDFSKTFVKFADETEKKCAKWEKEKREQLAKIEARKEASKKKN